MWKNVNDVFKLKLEGVALLQETFNSLELSFIKLSSVPCAN